MLRTVYAQVPPKVEYSLNELGQSVMPVMRQLNIWGREYAAALESIPGPEGKAPAPAKSSEGKATQGA